MSYWAESAGEEVRRRARIVLLVTPGQAATTELNDHEDHSSDLAQRLDVEMVETREGAVQQGADFMLSDGPDGLELHDLSEAKLSPMRVDFSKLDVRPGSPSLSKKQPLVKAVGKKNQSVLDLTAGVGQDAFLLAVLGYRVEAAERNPILAALLEDALARALNTPALAAALEGRLLFSCEEGQSLLARSKPTDVVYLDPMFPPKRKRGALPRKEMRMVRALVGDDPDAGALFELALACARDRVVVKRPHHAPCLGPSPDFEITGKLVRYDVYLTHQHQLDLNAR